MGSYIGIGLVFNNKFNSKEKSTLQMILEYFTSKNGKLLNAKFSEDEDGNDWKDIENLKLYEADNLLNKYYLNINFICDILGKTRVSVNAYYKNLNENVSGLLLDVKEELFLKGCPDEKIEEKTNQFIHLITDIYNVVEYDYALCDQEAMIKYTLDDIEKAKKEYSILLIPHFNKMEIVKNSWNIDGLTDRFNTGVEYIQIRYKCPCCGNYTFKNRLNGTYDICPVCFWEDAIYDYHNPDRICSCNKVSINEAKENFKRFGACIEEMNPYVRKPNEFEVPRDNNVVTKNNEIQIQCCEEEYNILYKRNNPNKLIIDKDIECPQNTFIVTINMPNGNKYEFAIFNTFLGLMPQILEKNNKLYVACNSKVTIIDLDSFTVIKTIETMCCVDKVSETKEDNLLIIVSEASLDGIDLYGNIIWHKDTELIECWDIKENIITIQTEKNIQRIDIENGNIIFEEKF